MDPLSGSPGSASQPPLPRLEAAGRAAGSGGASQGGSRVRGICTRCQQGLQPDGEGPGWNLPEARGPLRFSGLFFEMGITIPTHREG